MNMFGLSQKFLFRRSKQETTSNEIKQLLLKQNDKKKKKKLKKSWTKYNKIRTKICVIHIHLLSNKKTKYTIKRLQ